MKSGKHILLLVPGFPCNEDDSTCIPALQAMVREMHEQTRSVASIQVITFHYPFNRGDYLWNGINVWSAGGKNRPMPLKLFTWFRVLRQVFSLHRKQKIDIIYSFWLHECTFLATWIAKFTGASSVAMIMGQDVLPGNGYMKIISLRNTTVVANSPFSAELFEKNYKRKADAIIPIGLRYEDFDGIEYGERNIGLLNVGSLIPLKNQLLFIDLFRELKNQYPQITGAIVGSGVLENQLRKRITQLGLNQYLTLHAGMPRRKVLELMAQSRILVHTSSYESAGYVLLEALYSGMNVVSFKTGYLPESENAFACNTAEEMKVRIEKLLSDSLRFERTDVVQISETIKKLINLNL